jgi:hypothetical protein
MRRADKWRTDVKLLPHRSGLSGWGDGSSRPLRSGGWIGGSRDEEAKNDKEVLTNSTFTVHLYSSVDSRVQSTALVVGA